MSTFRFKKFSVVNERSAMKVNTDGVLLGALMTVLPSDKLILDIGTGTGTIALMAAQRLSDCVESLEHVRIDAIDVDEPSVAEAAENFRNSPWSGCLHSHHASLEEFESGNDVSSMHKMEFDLIFSNPPYFDNALGAPEMRRNAARHTSNGLSYREILDFASSYLIDSGRVAMVLPSDTEIDLTRHARMNGFHLNKITRIRTVPRKTPKLIVAEFVKTRVEAPQDTILTIQNEGQYTEEYLCLMKDFYLFA